MADKSVEKQASKIVDADERPHEVPLEEPLPGTNDPGGAHTKGYSAEPRPEPDVQVEGAIPLASVPEGESHVQQPERDGRVRPTGRRETDDYTPNDRLMGSDR